MNYRWMDRMERRVGALAMPGLAAFIAGMNGVVWVMTLLRPGFETLLALDPDLVRQGQWWRVLTFLFIPPGIAPLWMFFWLYLLYVYASALEREWGDFRFNLYYGAGAAATIAVSLLLGTALSNAALNAGIFLAFAALYPDFELLLFFVLPVKVKWLAYIAWLGILWRFLAGGWRERAVLAAQVANYALFFGPRHWEQARLKLQVWRNRRRFRS